MPKKQRKMKFLIEEHEGNVRAALVVDDRAIFEFEIEEVPPARVRYKRTDVDKLLEKADFWSTKEPRHGGLVGWLDFYAECRKREGTKQILGIRKAIKRLEGELQCVRVAQEAKKKLKNA